jgi:hypothetical protein
VPSSTCTMRLAGCCTSADPPRLAKGHPIMPELEKLPQARRYLRAARFGLHTLLELKIAGTGYIFHVIGLLTTLRAVPHVLMGHDSKLSPEHKAVIAAWRIRTKNFKEHPEFYLIIRARNQILKDGSFASYASSSESSMEPGVVHYETAHYLDGERRDLEIDVRAALDWMERELTMIEADLPPRYEEDDADQEGTSAMLSRMAEEGIPPQKIAGTTITSRIEDSAQITFSRRPEPWRDGDVLEIFHEPSGHTTLTATEHDGFRFTWKPKNCATCLVELEAIDDRHFRVVLVAA